MKYTIEHISQGEEEVILRCHSPSAEMEQLIRYLESRSRKLIGIRDGIRTVVEQPEILYVESVEGRHSPIRSRRCFRWSIPWHRWNSCWGQ